MKLAIIVAIDLNNGIGHDNDLLWTIPLDMKHFRKLTTNHPVIMGRKTFESIGKLLPNRTNIIVTRDKLYKVDGAYVVDNINDAIELSNTDVTFIIGGEEIYKQTIDIVDEMYVTQIHATSSCNKYFPKIDLNKWVETSSERHDETIPPITFLKYEKFISK